jgi:hypothetical protein
MTRQGRPLTRKRLPVFYDEEHQETQTNQRDNPTFHQIYHNNPAFLHKTFSHSKVFCHPSATISTTISLEVDKDQT